MKKLSFLFLSVAVCAFVGCKDPEEPKPTPDPDPVEPVSEVFTKQIVDGGFESCWYSQEMTNESYLEYKSSVFYTLNNLHALIEVPDLMLTSAPVTAYRDEDAHSGNYCMKLVTGVLTDQSKGRLLIPGAIAPLDPNFVYQFLTPSEYPDGINVKREYHEKPDRLKGYFKYTSVAGDSASISVKLYNGSEVIGEGLFVEYNTVESWTNFEAPIAYTSNVTPTHVSIIISASAGYNFADLTHCEGQEGSTLWIDDLEFTFPAK